MPIVFYFVTGPSMDETSKFKHRMVALLGKSSVWWHHKKKLQANLNQHRTSPCETKCHKNYKLLKKI